VHIGRMWLNHFKVFINTEKLRLVPIPQAAPLFERPQTSACLCWKCEYTRMMILLRIQLPRAFCFEIKAGKLTIMELLTH
jgi:hypothetical protein